MNKFIEVTSLRSGMNSLDRDRNMPCAFAEIEIPNTALTLKTSFSFRLIFICLSYSLFGVSVTPFI